MTQGLGLHGLLRGLGKHNPEERAWLPRCPSPSSPEKMCGGAPQPDQREEGVHHRNPWEAEATHCIPQLQSASPSRALA